MFCNLVRHFIHHMLCAREEIADGPDLEGVQYFQRVHDNEPLLLRFFAAVLEELAQDERIVFVLDLPSTLPDAYKDGLKHLITKMFYPEAKRPTSLRLLITSHVDTNISQLLSTFQDMTTYLRIPSSLNSVRSPLINNEPVRDRWRAYTGCFAHDVWRWSTTRSGRARLQRGRISFYHSRLVLNGASGEC